MYEKLDYTNSQQLCEQMAQETDTCILAFSTGKDSIAAWLQLRKFFKKIVPYYCYCVPELEFVEKSLKYYEDFFGQRIYRLPHRAFWRWIENGTFQTPKNIIAIENFPTPSYDDVILGEIIRYSGNLSENVYTAVGVRMADSPIRRISIKNRGAINHNSKTFYPVYDWKKEELIREIKAAGVKLPIDYQIFGRTFDGIDYRFLEPTKKHFPKDYKKVLEWFPLAELELYRRELVRNG